MHNNLTNGIAGLKMVLYCFTDFCNVANRVRVYRPKYMIQALFMYKKIC